MTWWVEPRWAASVRHRRARRVVAAVWVTPPVFPILAAGGMVVSVLAATVAWLNWHAQGWSSLKPLSVGATMAAITVGPLVAALYVLVAYVGRVFVATAGGAFIDERWYARGSVRRARVRSWGRDRRVMRVVGDSHRTAVVGVPPSVTGAQLDRLLGELKPTHER